MKTVQIALARTCNRICWDARGKSCRCVCGGRNHGALRHGGLQNNSAGDNGPDNGQTPDGEDQRERAYQMAVTFDQP